MHRLTPICRSLFLMRRAFGALLLATAVLGMASEAIAQPGDGERRQRGDRGDRGQRGGFDMQNMDPEQREQMMERMRDRMAERNQDMLRRQQEQLGFSDDEFAIVGPMIERVQRLVQEQALASSGGGGGRGGFGGMSAFMSDLATDEGRQVIEATSGLREVLEDDGAASGAIKASLEALRSARQAHASALKSARDDLRSVLTAKQEAEMVLSGALD